MSAFTARNYQLGEAPKKITLLGDKQQRPEPAQHIIEFPGGAIEVSRLEDGSYWAHVIINRSWAAPFMRGLQSAYGEVIGSRVTRRGIGGDISDIADFSAVEQIAVLIRPTQHHEKDGG